MASKRGISREENQAKMAKIERFEDSNSSDEEFGVYYNFYNNRFRNIEDVQVICENSEVLGNLVPKNVCENLSDDMDSKLNLGNTNFTKTISASYSAQNFLSLQSKSVHFNTNLEENKSSENCIAKSTSFRNNISSTQIESGENCESNLSSEQSFRSNISSTEIKASENLNHFFFKSKVISSAVPSLPVSNLFNSRKSSLKSRKFSCGKQIIVDSVERKWKNSCQEQCNICRKSPKNGIFLHNGFGHMCACFECSLNYWRINKNCGHCHRKVKRVIKAFVV